MNVKGGDKNCRLQWYVGNITVDPRHEVDKVISSREAFPRESVPQRNNYLEKAVQMERPF